MNRIKSLFLELNKKKRKALGIFLTAGDPNLETSFEVLKNLKKNGADFIEIGMPFSDPMADGPTIQESSQRALKAKMTLEKCLLLVKKIRLTNNEIPIILMGYFNPIYKYGKEKFIHKAISYGVDGLIIVDLPPEEDDELYNYSEKHELSFIRLVTPTTNEARLSHILKGATGFIYYVSITGITGTGTANSNEVAQRIRTIKKYTDLPIIIGFGIRTGEQAKEMASISDGIVIGSALVEKIKNTIDENGNPTKSTVVSCLQFVSEVSDKMRHN